MKGLVLASIDVLTINSGPLAERQPSPSGIEVVHALSERSNGMLGVIIDGAGNQNDDLGRRWCSSHGIKAMNIYWGWADKSLPDRRRVLQECLLVGPVAWYIDTDPACIQMALREGVAGLLLTEVRYPRPEWRPDASKVVRPWDELIGELSFQEQGE